MSHSGEKYPAYAITVYLGGVELAVVQLQDLQGCLEVGLRLRKLHLNWPQAVDVRR